MSRFPTHNFPKLGMNEEIDMPVTVVSKLKISIILEISLGTLLNWGEMTTTTGKVYREFDTSTVGKEPG